MPRSPAQIAATERMRLKALEKKRLKNSNQNEPKTFVENGNAIHQGQSVLETSGSLHSRKDAGSSQTDEGNLHRDSSQEHSQGSKATSRTPLHGSNGGQLHVQREGNQEVGSSKLLAQQVHSESKTSRGGQSSSSDNRPNAASNPDSNATSISFDEQIKRLRDPVYFARAFCLKSLDEWQVKFLGDARTPGRTALRGANGIGKTVIICVLILFFLSTIRNCRVVIVSGVFRQLKMMVDHLQSLLKNFPGWRVLRGSHELLTPFPENKAIWFSTDSPGAAQGQHSVVDAVSFDDASAYIDSPEALDAIVKDAREKNSCVILIRDECRDIPSGVKASTDTFGALWTFDLSCPGNAVEWFHDIFNRLADMYRCHHVTAYESSFISKKYIEEFKQIHNESSARFKNAIMAEFSDVDVKNLITLDQIHRCYKNPQPWQNPGYKKAGIDLSAAKKGGDEMWCVPCQGNKLLEPYCLPNCQSEMEAIGLVVRWLKTEKIRYVMVDNGGLGSPMIARLEEVLAGDQSIEIIRVNFGGKPLNPSLMCENRGTELWVNGSNKIELRNVIFEWTEGPKNKFVAQATSREIKPVLSNGIIGLGPKSKCVRSPDLADATFLALSDPPRVFPMKIGNNDWNNKDPFERHNSDNDLATSYDGYNLGGGF